MYKVSLVNNDYNKPTNYEISTSKEYFICAILSAVGSVINSLEQAQELITLIKETNYKDHEAILLEVGNVSVLVYTCEPYIRDPHLLRDLKNYI